MGPDKQGLGWVFQILPYLEGQTTYNIKVQQDLQRVSVPMYSCPSRRTAALSPLGGAYLLDYAVAVPARTRFERPAVPDWLALQPAWGIAGCARSEAVFWTSTTGQVRFEADINAQAAGFAYIEPKGVVVRSGFCKPCAPAKQITPWANRISFEDIEDGSSNTFVIGEKRLVPSLSTIGAWYDDAGWTDGWDPDTLRSTFCIPAPDQDIANMPGASALPYSFGGTHTGLFVGGFADASVRPIRFEIDIEVFNYLGHRSDGQQIDLGTL